MWHIAIVASDLAAPEQSVGRLFRSGGASNALHPLCADHTVRKRPCAAAARNLYEARMTAEIIQFIPKPNPKLTEAIDTAKVMIGEGKCAEPNCARGFSGCSAKGCLFETVPYGGKGIDGMNLEKDPA